MKKLELWWPVKPYGLNQGWGVNGEYYRKNGIDILGHNGLDFYAPTGKNVRAAHDGEVTFTGYDGSAGLGVVLKTLEPFEYGGKEVYFKTIYWHLLPGTVVVKPGQIVKVGDILAESNNTGFSSGSHLHFGLKPIARGEEKWSWFNLEQKNGYWGAIDPTPYFTGFHAFDAQTMLGVLKQDISMYQKIREMLKLWQYGRRI